MEIKQTPRGPIAEKGTHIRRFHGHEENDPWQWLDVKPQDANYWTVQELVALENKHAHATIEPTRPLREKIVAEIRAYTNETDVSAPVKHAEHWYYTRTTEGVDYPVLCRVNSNDVPTLDAHQPAPGEEIILDQNQRAAGLDFYQVANQYIDTDKNRFIWGEDTTGGEVYDLKVMDLNTKEIIDDTVKNVGYTIAVTGNDLYYVRVDEAWRAHQIWVHEIGTPATTDQLVLTEPDERFEIWLNKSRDGNWINIVASATLSTRNWLLPADGTRRMPRPVTEHVDGLRYSVEPAGDHLLITHNQLTENESLALAPTPTIAEFEGTSSIIPLCPAQTWVNHWPIVAGERLLEVAAFETFVAFGMRSAGQTAIRIWPRINAAGNDLQGIYGQAIDINWDLDVRVLEIGNNPNWHAQTLRFTVESFAQPLITAEYSVVENRTQIIKELQVSGFNPAEYETKLAWVRSRDGVQIPVSMVYKRGIQPDGTNPGLIYGYGSYEASMEPWFSINRLTLLNRGVVYAMAHIRGGGELGREWYEQGKFAVKTNTFNDFVDASRWLIESGWVAEGRLAAQGGSAGGLLMGAIANQAPSLYKVVDAHVPFVDALNTILDPSKPLTTGEWDEWGNPIESAEIYNVMRAYSPYENVEPVAYPTIIAQTSLNDIRVSYVEPLKWVQRLRDISKIGEENPVICLIEEVAGHAGGSGRSKKWDEFARSTAFLLQQLGVVD